MTDEDVAYAQARGELTPQQELAWLKRQAARLAAVRDSQDMEMMSVEEEEVAPAQPGELPPWLAQMREESEQARPPEPSPLTEGIGLPEGVIDLASLLDEAAAGVGFDLSEVEIDTDEQLIEAVEELWAEQPSQADLELLGEFVPESELAAFLESGLMPDEHDPLAEALDAEFERRLTGDETEPEWYTDAVARVAAEAPAVPEMEAELPGEAPAEPVVAEAMPVEMPDWLKEAEEELQEPMASDSAVPDWLQEPSEAEPAIPTELPEWLVERAEELEPAMEGDVPDWLLEIGSEEPEVSAVDWLPAEAQEPEVAQTVAEPTPPPAPEPVAPAPPPVTRAVPPAAPVAPAPVKAAPTVPPGEFFETYRQRLEADPDDHPSRLGLARALRASQEWVSSLDHYEALIETSQLLQDVSGDLISVVEQQPKTPRARRLLGDAYMRQGMLQEALDAYRSALNQL
jgi:tetratricopeptide (TPR) repeat protein